jgi:hypothetical protein
MKSKRPCVDCGGMFLPAAMEFDHLPTSEKRFNLAQAGHRNLREVLAELEKCELVCANRARTIGRGRDERRRVTGEARQAPLFAG